jgi:hypothetical protein
MGTSPSPNQIVSSRIQQTARVQKFIDGLKKHEQTLSSLVIRGQSIRVADIIPLLQKRLDKTSAVSSAKATWQSAVQADHDERDQTKNLLADLRQALLVAFGGQIEALADFGLVGRKPAVVAPETRVAAAAKAKATRAARHTMGKNQKAQITGVVVTPATSSPSTPAPAPAAAPPAAPSAGTTPRPLS